MKLPIAPVIHLLHDASHAVLSTHSTQLSGFPYGTAVPLVVDEFHQPLLLISALAEHTKNLLADPKASLAVLEPGKLNVQDAARATLLGRVEPFEPSLTQVQSYLRYQPDAAQYLQLDFMFFRLNIERARFIAGIGKMGWLESSDWHSLEAISGADQNRLLSQAEPHMPSRIRLLGVDSFGIDYATDGRRKRHRFELSLTTDEIGMALPELVRDLT